MSPKIPKPTTDELVHRFNHHPPVADQAERYGQVRHMIRTCADYCIDRTPASREQERALEKLDEAMMLFNAAIARHEARDPATKETPPCTA
jgi:hypothetical protein